MTENVSSASTVLCECGHAEDEHFVRERSDAATEAFGMGGCLACDDCEGFEAAP